MKRPLMMVALVALTLGMSGCGDDGSSATATTDPNQARQQAALDAAQCMRDKGFNMPDPEFTEDGGAMMKMDESNGIDPDDPKFQAAEDECNKQMDALVGAGDERTPEEKQQFQDDMIAYAQCMRDNGVDMPDPTFDDKGRVTMRSGSKEDSPTDKEVMDKAEAACRDKNAMAGGTTNTDGPSSEQGSTR